MKVDIYQAVGSKIDSKRWYVFVKAKTGLDILPNKVKQAANGFSLTKSLEISKGEYRIAIRMKLFLIFTKMVFIFLVRILRMNLCLVQTLGMNTFLENTLLIKFHK